MRNSGNIMLLVLLLAAVISASCSIPETPAPYIPPTFETFMQYEVKAIDDDTFLVEGDIIMTGLSRVQAYYNQVYGSMAAAGVSRSTVALLDDNVTRDIWSPEQKLNLTYCVSRDFGEYYEYVKLAMLEATAAWERYADVEFTYRADQDTNARDGNPNVTFPVRPVTEDDGAVLLEWRAASFLPNDPTLKRRLAINQANTFFFKRGVPKIPFVNKEEMYKDLVTLCIHELGHSLGLLHEHAWYVAWDGQYQRNEGGNAQLLTSIVDTYSIMAYPDFLLDEPEWSFSPSASPTNMDETGIQILYGANPARYAAFFTPAVPGYTQTNTSSALLLDSYSFNEKLHKLSDGIVAPKHLVDNLNVTVIHGQPKYSCTFINAPGRLVGKREFYCEIFAREIQSLCNGMYEAGFKIRTMDSYVLSGVDYYAVIFEQYESEYIEPVIFGATYYDFLVFFERYWDMGFSIKCLTVNSWGQYSAVLENVADSTPDERFLEAVPRSTFISVFYYYASLGYWPKAVDSYLGSDGVDYYTAYFDRRPGSRWTVGWEIKDLESLQVEYDGDYLIRKMTVY